jgi:hypothetical protein
LELQRWWVLKSKIFGHESTNSMEKNEKRKKIGSSKNCQIVPSKLIFDVKNGKHEKNPKK